MKRKELPGWEAGGAGGGVKGAAGGVPLTHCDWGEPLPLQGPQFLLLLKGVFPAMWSLI